MESIVLYSEEIDELNETAEELFSQAKDFSFKKNTMGIFFCDPDLDYGELYPILRERWDFPIVGATALSSFTGDGGFKKTGISFMLITADDCGFACGMTEKLSQENYTEEIQKTARSLDGVSELSTKLILTYGGIIDGVMGDDIIRAVDSIGEKVPIYGALASDILTYDSHRVFCNERSEREAEVLVFISGNISPRFLNVASITTRANFSYTITKAGDNKVYRVGDSTFVDALKASGMESGKADVLSDFVLSPFILTLKQEDGASVEVFRNVAFLDEEEGSGSFLGGVASGTALEIGLISQTDLNDSVREAFSEVLKILKAPENTCRTIICSSCASRYLAIGGRGDLETGGYSERLPDGVSLMGMYSYGEICPVEGENNKFYNVFHNSTFTILMV